ncbi:MAG: hypothetical protein AAB875_06190 [Patescibacteria group bacterium]
MPLDPNKYKKQQQELKSKRGNTWKPSEGEAGNIIRVFLFGHKVTDEDVKRGFYGKENLNKAQQELNFKVVRHFSVLEDSKRPVFSTAFLMEKYKAWRDSNEESVQEQAKEIKPQTAYAINILDINDMEKGIQTWLCPSTVMDSILDYWNDPDYGDSIFGCKGRDFKIKFDKSAPPAKMYMTKLRDEKNCKAVGSNYQEQVKDLYDPKLRGIFAIDFVQEDSIFAGENGKKSGNGSKAEKGEDKPVAAKKGKTKNGGGEDDGHELFND